MKFAWPLKAPCAPSPACAPAPVLDLLDTYSPTFDEIKTVEIKELERAEINLSTDVEEISARYLVVGDQLRELPIGSTLDKENGIFYWQPGPGFIGEYHFIFTGKDDQDQFIKKNIIINIKSKEQYQIRDKN